MLLEKKEGARKEEYFYFLFLLPSDGPPTWEKEGLREGEGEWRRTLMHDHLFFSPSREERGESWGEKEKKGASLVPDGRKGWGKIGESPSIDFLSTPAGRERKRGIMGEREGRALLLQLQAHPIRIPAGLMGGERGPEKKKMKNPETIIFALSFFTA